jgi:hypothetical protein
MDTYEAKIILEDSVRCVARMMEQIRLRETEKVMGWDEPMQDHLSECTWAMEPHDGSSLEDCMEFLKRLHKGFTVAYEHEALACDVASKNHNDYDLIHIADMVRGWIGHGFPDYLVECAKEVNAVAKELLPPGAKYVKSEKGCEKIVNAFLDKAEEIIKKHNLQTWDDGCYGLPLGYLHSWMKRKYWGE